MPTQSQPRWNDGIPVRYQGTTPMPLPTKSTSEEVKFIFPPPPSAPPARAIAESADPVPGDTASPWSYVDDDTRTLRWDEKKLDIPHTAVFFSAMSQRSSARSMT